MFKFQSITLEDMDQQLLSAHIIGDECVVLMEHVLPQAGTCRLLPFPSLTDDRV